MNVLNFYTNTQLRGNIGQRLSLDFKVAEIYCSHENHITYETEAISIESPILATAYDGGKHIASANEVGTVDLLDIHNLQSKYKWELHQNAIFDIKWRPDVSGQLLTASGDLSITLVDIFRPKDKIVAIEKSHICSVRSVDFHDSNVFASGARDGHVKVWDLRDCNAPVLDIPFAHVAETKISKRRYKRYRSCPANAVTSILFSGYHLFSGGASDGLIKVWDIRKQTSKIQPLKQMSFGGKSNFSDKQGYTSLVMSKGFLYASCSDKTVYCYSPYQEKIVGRYKGARINNYSKVSILNDEYLICGSMDKCACLWKIKHQQDGDQPILPSYILPENSEVDSVEAVNQMGLIFTGTDQGRLRRWTFEPLKPNENGNYTAYDKIELYKEEKKEPITDIDSENFPTITVEDYETTHPVRSKRTKRNLFATPVRGEKRPVRNNKRRRSPRTLSPKGKKSRTKPSEPLTPITNYYQKLPKNDSPKGQS